MSFFTDAFKVIATVTNDVVAKSTRAVVSVTGEIAGVFDEKAKHDIQRAGLQAEQAIRRNPLIDAINEIDNHERKRTKDLIRYIDTTLDIDQPKETPANHTNLWQWSVRAYASYLFHTLHDLRKIDEVRSSGFKVDDVLKHCEHFIKDGEVDLDLITPYLTELLSEWKIEYVDKDCYVASKDSECIIGFCGTLFSDLDHLLADATVGNLVAGYHYKMADIACMYYDLLENLITSFSTISITGHSLGAGIGIYMNLLFYWLHPHKSVTTYGFGVPCVLPRVFKNRLSHRLVHIIDNNDPVPKYYKNENVAHANKLIHIDYNDVKHRYVGQFSINWNRFNPLCQLDKFQWDKNKIESHYMKSYMSILKYQHENDVGNSAINKSYMY